MSWWKLGHELGEQAPAGVEYRASVPSRVIETTSFLAPGLVSIVPSEPSTGVATVQPPVSFGHAVLAALPSMSYACRSSEAVPPRTSCLGARPVTSPTTRPVMNERSLLTVGNPGANWPELAFQAAVKSWLPFW